MNEMTQSYVTFHVTAKDGRDVEMAIVDEFDFEKRHYVVSCVVENDTIDESGQYIYRSRGDGDDFTVEKITNAVDYRRVVDAYMSMDTADAE